MNCLALAVVCTLSKVSPLYVFKVKLYKCIVYSSVLSIYRTLYALKAFTLKDTGHTGLECICNVCSVFPKSFVSFIPFLAWEQL